MRVSQARTESERDELVARQALTDIADRLGRLGYPGRSVVLEGEVSNDPYRNKSLWIYAVDRWTNEPVSLDRGGNGSIGVPKEAKYVNLSTAVDAEWIAKDIKRALILRSEEAAKEAAK